MLAQDHYLCIIIGMFFFSQKKHLSNVLWVFATCFKTLKVHWSALKRAALFNVLTLFPLKKKKAGQHTYRTAPTLS